MKNNIKIDARKVIDRLPLAESTRETYWRCWRLYAANQNTVQDAYTDRCATAYLQAYAGRCSAQAYNVTRAAIRHVLAAQGVGITAKALPRAVSVYRRPLRLEQALHLMLTACQVTEYDCALTHLLLATGVRTVEISRACVDDLREQDGGYVLWVHGKGRKGKDAFVHLSDKLCSILSKHIAVNCHAGGPLFPNRKGYYTSTRDLRRRMRHLMDEAGVLGAGISTHSLRHTFATIAVEAGADIEAVQAELRHAHPEQTTHYARTALAKRGRAATDIVSKLL